MKNVFASISMLGTFLALAAAPAAAQSLVEGDAAAGQAKSTVCAACHGNEGNSVNPLWPNVAGQHATYTVQTLKAFQEGARQNALMSNQAMMLSDEDINNLAVYYENLPAAAQSVSNPDTFARGERLYRGGDSESGVAACIACHGPAGLGNAAAGYPALNGQHAAYTVKQLQDYASGARQTYGANEVMNAISARLSQEDMEALASYIQGLHARPADAAE
ncbi:MAG: c-type cytochrome [Woeseiaceae bacterium]|nr:c-type cytochrome [Woeseiaceae bacterium]